MQLTVQDIARAVNGKVSGQNVRAPGPGHSRNDDSLAIKLADNAHGFIVYSHSPSDHPQECFAYVRERLKAAYAWYQPKANGNGTPRPKFPTDDEIARIVAQAQPAPRGKLIAAYDYTDAGGVLQYQVCRFEPKRFMHRQPDGNGGWIWKGSERRVVYRWPDLIAHPDATVFVTEGEKDADNVAALDLVSTTVASGKWTDECVAALAGRHVYIIKDADEAGAIKAQQAAALLQPVCASVKIVELAGLDGTKGNKDVSDWLDQGHTKDELVAVCANAPYWEPDDTTRDSEKPASGGGALTVTAPPIVPTVTTGTALIPQRLFPLVKASDLIASDIDDEYLIDDLLPRVGLAVMWGSPKTGKSFWALDVAFHVALGWPYRDHAVQQGAVVYLALEGQKGVKKRVAAFYKHHFSDDRPDTPFHLMLKPAEIVTQAQKLIDEIRFDLGETVPKLVVIDTLARAMRGDENNPKDMGAFIAAADKIQHAFDCCVLVVHHCGWTGEHSRGSSTLPGALDVELSCGRANPTAPIVVKVERAKDMAEDVEIVSMLRLVDTGKINKAGKPIMSMVMVPADPDAIVRKRRFSGDVELAYDALIDAINERGEFVTTNKRIPPTSRAILLSEWLSAFESKDVKSDTPSDSRRTAFRRAVRKLQKENIVGFIKPYAWLLKEPGQFGQSGQL